MQLQEQVISLEQARKIKSLWFSKESFAIHIDLEDWIWRIPISYYGVEKDYNLDEYEYYHAYTASELMDILPHRINKPYIQEVWDNKGKQYNDYFYLEVYRWHDTKYSVYYTYLDLDDRTQVEEEISNINFAQALWDMLIFLLENNLIHKQE